MLGKILLTGGHGLLGTELQKYFTCEAPDSKKLDITDVNTMVKYDPDIVIHAAAYTDVTKAETDKERCFNVNVRGTYNLTQIFPKAYFVYISSEYAKNPVNFYSQTKQWGEEMVIRYCANHLIIRTLFKASPFPYKYAFFDQWSQGDSVDIIAPMIVKEILRGSVGLHNIGTGRKTMFELARRTVPDIKAISVDDIKDVRLPKDYL